MYRVKEIPKNTNPNLWNEESKLSRYNCGSLAFDVSIWYSPEWILEEKFEDIAYVDELAERMWEKEFFPEEIADIYANLYLEAILIDFKDEVSVYDSSKSIKEDEELIAFRVGSGEINEDGYYESDIDFHFKVFRNGKWIEKNGSGDVHNCEVDDWIYDSYEYNSRTIYLVRKLNKI